MPTVTPQLVDNVLKDLFVLGVGAAGLFVKNDAHKVEAAAIVQVLGQLLPLLEQQFGGASGVPAA